MGRRGVINRVMDWFWSAKASDGDAGMAKIHVPIASDLCQVSADLLFSEPPAITVEGDKAQERLDLIAGAQLDMTLVAGAEVSAALGGQFLRVVWDDTLFQHAFITRMDADGAVPTFRYGQLTAVTFWRVVHVDGGIITRHLERHELDAFGVGVVFHGLYKGDAGNLGIAIPLTDHDATAGLAMAVDGDSKVSTETPGLAVGYAPNIGPNRRWRLHPYGASLGRSDLDGLEPLMDAFDRVYSSLMRDIEMGKARLLVAESALTDLGPGKGAVFDTDQAIFTGLRLPPGAMGDAKFPVEQVQFAIRVAEHLSAAEALYAQIVRTAGYSSQTFGEKDGNGAGDTTATEVTAKERRSYLTRDRKIRALKPVLEQILAKALAVDAAKFNTGVTPGPVTVEFADAVQTSPEALARTAGLLRTARAASTKVLVEMVHPDWDEETVDEEVARIVDEEALANPPMPDPMFADGGVDNGPATANKPDTGPGSKPPINS
jgi:A118 family predicted phage portal protein